jgi:NAD(P)H-quinone oxidoreductase subunit 5
VAQMGFMMLECGLGAFHMALLHLVAHSLYKAHAFLSSGSVVGTPSPAQPRAVGLAAVFSSVLGAMLILFLTAQVMGVNLQHSTALHLIFSIALAQVLWTVSGTGGSGWRIPVGLVSAVGLSAAYLGLEEAAQLVVRPAASMAGWIGIGIAGLLLVAAIAQSQLPRLLRTSRGMALYVHARNGFYFNTLANRLTRTMWPVGLSKEGI